MRYLLFVCFILLSIISNSQIVVEKVEQPIEIGKVKINGGLSASLSYNLDKDKDTIYTLLYRNFDYQTLVKYETFVFSNEGNTLNQFYDVLKSFFTEENKKNKDYQVTVRFGDKSLMLSNFRTMGVTSVLIQQLNQGYIYLTEKQVNKLFNRQEE